MNEILYTLLIWISSLNSNVATIRNTSAGFSGIIHEYTVIHASIDENKCTECHADLMSLKQKHTPAIESCDKCHKSNGKTHPDKGNKGFNFTKAMPELCFSCHDLKSKKNLHQPSKEGKCIECHSPHSSANKKLLTVKKSGDLCKKCHDLKIGENDVVHNPVGSNRCHKCHDPHQSDNDSYLKDSVPALCFNCHEGVAEEMSLKRIHVPAKENCFKCHDPHSNKQSYLLPDTVPTLCYSCHTDINIKKNLHQPAKEGKCSNCHNAHGSNNKSLLKDKKSANLCKKCHQLDIPENNVVHNPVNSGRCHKCHDPHQSDFGKFLKLEVPNLCYNCHDGIAEEMKLKTIHAPAKENCFKCHDPHSNKESYLLPDTIPNLCYTCHSDIKTKKNIHAPTREGKCTSCHNIHGSNNKKLVKEKKSVKLCNECHQLEIPENDVVHNPVSSGRCHKCHDPHSSDFDNFLKNDMPNLCFNCHDGIEEAINAEHAHTPAKENCFKCHDPHSNKESYLLAENVPNLCYSCHQDFKTKIEKDTIVHKALSEGSSCANCHSPHGSKEPGGLKMPEKEMCLSCHNKSYTSELGTIDNIKNILDKSKFTHGPVNSGCVICHDPHASKNPYLMSAKFPVGEYAPALKENFALCFNCHNSELIEKKESNTATNFRNGNRNLHVVHINGNRGRNCTTCHDIHGAKNEHLIANKATYGNWKMPIQFKKLQNGGSCFPGCHAEKKYERGL